MVVRSQWYSQRTFCPLIPTSQNILRYRISWLGHNSKQGKLNRQLTEIQARMRLKTSADKIELRQSYIPALFPYVVKPLMDSGVVSLTYFSRGVKVA